MPCQVLPFPQELRPRLPTIVGNVDYLTLRQRLEQIDALLRDGGVEIQFVELALARWLSWSSWQHHPLRVLRQSPGRAEISGDNRGRGLPYRRGEQERAQVAQVLTS